MPTASPPTDAPTKEPTSSPTTSPTDIPTSAPTASPTDPPTEEPTLAPTGFPTNIPTSGPTTSTTNAPTEDPTTAPVSLSFPNNSKQFGASYLFLSHIFVQTIGSVEMYGVDVASTRRITGIESMDGQIPTEIGLLTALTFLFLYGGITSGTMTLEDNLLLGEIPSEIGLLTELRPLRLETNELTGTIPSELGELTELTYLNLKDYHMQLTGRVPQSICAIPNLETVVNRRVDCCVSNPSISNSCECD